MSKKRVLAPGEYYHVYNRGVEKRQIFMDESDHRRFLALLYLCNSSKDVHVQVLKEGKEMPYEVDREKILVAIGAYCLMPNHIHLLLRECSDGGITRFMQKLSTAYAMYFNKKYKRVGPLFQGVFKAQHVGNDEHLKYLYAYIHLNPVKQIDQEGWGEQKIQRIHEADKFLLNFPYSSYKDFLGEIRPEGNILSRADFPEYFEKESDFRSLIKTWLNFKPGP